MNTEKQISALCKLSSLIQAFLEKEEKSFNRIEEKFQLVLKKTETENSWFTQAHLKFALKQWAEQLNQHALEDWLSRYKPTKFPKKIGLVLAGNIPLVGFHDILCVLLSGHEVAIKTSSKDKYLTPFLLEIWENFLGEKLNYSFVEQLKNIDAVIATGSNNTAQYLEYYFREHPKIIRKNKTSVAVLTGNESETDLNRLAEDIFTYFGMGCRNVTQLFIPEDFLLDKLFESFVAFGNHINHNAYANNYDYHKAIYLLNRDYFWDNNFILLKEDENLFSPIGVLFFSRYKNIDEVSHYLKSHETDIQCVVSAQIELWDSVGFGEAQKPDVQTYADQIDTMKFLEVL